MSGQFYIYGQEIRHNYEKLVNAYNTLKSKTGKRICALEVELKKSRGLVKNLNNRSCIELQQLRRQLFELEEKMERHKKLYEEKINQNLSTEVCTCSGISLSDGKTNCDESHTDNNSSVVNNNNNNNNNNNTTPCVTVTCESCIFHKTQLDELNYKICDLLEEIKDRTETLHGSEQLNLTFSRKLDEKDRDLSTLARQLHRKMVKCSRLRSKLQRDGERNNALEATNAELSSANAELSDKNAELSTENDVLSSANAELSDKNTELSTENDVLSIKNTELSSRLDEVEDELSNAQCRLNAKLDEMECAKNLEIQEHMKTLKELECRLISQGEQLQKSEESKNVCEEICNDLMKKNNEFQNALNKRNEENAILDEIVKKLQDSCRVANDKITYLRTNLETCAANLKSSIEENKILKSECECVKIKLEDNEKILCDTRSRLNESNEKNRTLMSKIEVICDKLNCYEKIIHDTELSRNEALSENNKRKSDLETVSNEYKRLIDVNNSLCERIADLELRVAHKCQADVIDESDDNNNNNNETALCLCAARTSSDGCSCSTGLDGKTTTTTTTTTTVPPCAHTSSDDTYRHDDSIVSKYHVCDVGNEMFKRQLTENVETILSIQRKAQDTENELKQRCDKMAHMLVEVQETVLKNHQVNAQNKTMIDRTKVDNIVTDETDREKSQKQTKQTPTQTTNVTDSKPNSFTPRGAHETISTSRRNDVIQKSKETTDKLRDESSGENTEQNENNKLIEKLTRQLEMGIRKHREAYNNEKNHNLYRSKTLGKHHRLSGKI